MDDLDDVFRLLEKAKLLEKDGQRIEASTKYYEGCHLMRQIVSKAQFPQGIKDPAVDLLREKIQFYTQQAQRLYFDEGSVMPLLVSRGRTTPASITLSAKASDDVSVLTLPGNQPSVFTEMHRKVGIGNARLEQAIRQEEEEKYNHTIENRNKEAIIQSYVSAAEAYLAVLRLSEESSTSMPPIAMSRLVSCLDRIEVLKNHPTGRQPSHPMDKKIT